MHIFLTGSTGFIGSHVLQALCQQGDTVTCLVRKPSKKKLLAQPAAQELAAGGRLSIIEAEWTKPADWLVQVAGHEVVINTVGIIRERHKGDFEAVHRHTPIALFQQAATSRVRQIIQISAMGADEMAASKFHVSKRCADRYLSQLNVSYVIIRPSFVYGYGGSSMAFFTRLAALPVTPVLGDGQYCVQPIHIDDLVKAITITLHRNDLRSIVVDAGGSEILTFNQMLDVLGHQLGKSVRHCHIPWNIIVPIAKVMSFLGMYELITTEEISMLKRGSFADNKNFVEFFGFKPMTFSEGIAHSRIIARK